MRTHHLYIANPPEHALQQIESYGRGIGLGPSALSVLHECAARAWEDGFAELSSIALAHDLGMPVGDVHAALYELADCGIVEAQERINGTFLVRPLFLTSEVGTQAGIGWVQRLELDYDG